MQDDEAVGRARDYRLRMPKQPPRESARGDGALARALALVRDLRARCPWDRAQTRETLRPYLVEEALELVGQRGRLAVPERLIELQGFFDQVGAQRLARLSAVPGATRAQIADERESAGERPVAARGFSRWLFGHS